MIKVLVIDDSALVREVLSNILLADDRIKVIGTARNPLEAIKKIKKERPDVLTLDLQMPKMDGLTFLRRLMSTNPLPVIVISSLTREGSQETIKALELGAIDFVAKPTLGINQGLKQLSEEIITKIKNAATINLSKVTKQVKHSKLNKATGENKESKQKNKVLTQSTIEMIAIGASTGGTVALRNILQSLPADMPAIVGVLHMPKEFTNSYAQSLNSSCNLQVKEAEDGEQVLPGCVYIAPGGQHLIVEKSVTDYYLKLEQGPPVNHHRPAIDKTFTSIADIVAPNCVGVILTGMGSDGAAGLEMMHNRGAFTIAQDEKSSIVFGMPRKAIELEAASEILPLNNIAETLIKTTKN
ncbi:protein-glutamate methylesterase/protein-glutamine glutaminase [Fuchsiella alkaliacetigena]|uniref:protein-glutamate methylesterase/protein-glutamine glutaminase n=1 Tax=Fuchsiella alkaliacetigena TaxID=957042 RepID=UPI00200A830C|nr:chemotaxis response regulator protein-glutamate methylesterase [Fuchsiella alkaliacetigena]MCK8823892.1 chemotaxis response regulator protein-glutamate methylesterase [Fuchsiella alkaliacetigena]